MSCQSCTAQGRDHDSIVSQCLASPLATGYYLCGFDKLDSELHHCIDEWFVKKISEGKKRFVIMVPRGSLKTTLFGTATIVWRNLVDREARTLLVMAAAVEAAKTSEAVKTVHMSDQMKHFFPDRVHDPKKHTGKSGFMDLDRRGIYREHTLEARGATSAMTGGHFTWQIFDDLIDENMADSDKDQDRVIRFFRGATNMFVNKMNDVRIVIGTLWEGMFYEWLLEDSGIMDYYEKLIIGAEVDDRFRAFLAETGRSTTLEDGDPIWPENETKESLEYTKIEEGPLIYARQMLNIKTTDEDRRFREEDFQYYVMSADNKVCIVQREGKDGRDFRVPVERMFRTMVIDPATGEGKKTDDSAISVVGQDHDTGLIFVLDEWAFKVQPFALIERILDMAIKWNPHKIGPEDASYQKTLKVYLRQAMVERGLAWHIDPVKPHGRAKLTRIDALQPFVRNRQIYVQRQHSKLVDELCGLQIIRGELLGKSPNRADALAYHVDFWRPQLVKQPGAEPEIPYWEAERLQNHNIPSYGLEAAV